MKILHVTPHLGGGVGKAHAAMTKALPRDVRQTFVLLEAPRDVRYVDAIQASGAQIVVVPELDRIAALAEAADIVQFEFWNHPRLLECLARCDFPAMRTLFWSHISGLFPPVIPPGLIGEAGRFVFTTEASRANSSLRALDSAAWDKISVINSGFGLDDISSRPLPSGGTPAIAYLGTVDFIKMHPGFFDAIEALVGDDIRVSVWGNVDLSGPVTERAAAMRHPERVRFQGQTDNPAAALSSAEIFFYPLQREHYGTAENALVEAMSLGLAPVVLDNPAEAAIVRHGETGLVAQSAEDCTAALQTLLSSPELRRTLGRNAAEDIAKNKCPARSAQDFIGLWNGLLAEPSKRHDFLGAIGTTPAEWFLATQHLPGQPWRGAEPMHQTQRSKGSLAHFASVFPGDTSLSRLAEAGSAT